MNTDFIKGIIVGILILVVYVVFDISSNGRYEIFYPKEGEIMEKNYRLFMIDTRNGNIYVTKLRNDTILDFWSKKGVVDKWILTDTMDDELVTTREMVSGDTLTQPKK